MNDETILYESLEVLIVKDLVSERSRTGKGTGDMDFESLE